MDIEKLGVLLIGIACMCVSCALVFVAGFRLKDDLLMAAMYGVLGLLIAVAVCMFAQWVILPAVLLVIGPACFGWFWNHNKS